MDDCCGMTFLYAVNVCCSHWLIIKLFGPIARQDKVRWKKQSKEVIKKGTLGRAASQMENKSGIQNGMEVKAASLGAVHGFIDRVT